MADTAIVLILYQSPSLAYDWLSRMCWGGLDALRYKAKPGGSLKINPNLCGDINMIGKQPAACGIPWRLTVLALHPPPRGPEFC